MQITLTEIEKKTLESRHRKERDSRVCDPIKAVLLRSESWSIRAIAQALRSHPEIVSQYLKECHEKKPITSLIPVIAAALGIPPANYRVARTLRSSKTEYTNATFLA